MVGEEADTCWTMHIFSGWHPNSIVVVGGPQLSPVTGRRQPALKSGMASREHPNARRGRRGESTDKPRITAPVAVDDRDCPYLINILTVGNCDDETKTQPRTNPHPRPQSLTDTDCCNYLPAIERLYRRYRRHDRYVLVFHDRTTSATVSAVPPTIHATPKRNRLKKASSSATICKNANPTSVI